MSPASKPVPMSDRFTVLIADFLDETSIESAVLDDIARACHGAGHAMSRSSAEYLPQADAILLFHDISIVGEPSFARAPRAGAWSGPASATTTSTSRPRRGTAWSSATCPTTAPRKSPTTRSCSCWRSCAGWCRRTRRSARAPGTTGPPLGAPRLRGKTFGVVGCGRIGTATALRAKALGLDVVFYDPYLRQGMDKALGIRRVYQLEELLEQSHFVSLHCYLDATNRHLINARTIARMRPGAILINTARGPLVDETALLEALDSGQIAAAGLDVVETRAARKRTPAPASQHPAYAPHGVLQRRGLRRAAHQDRRGSPAHPAGRSRRETR